MKILWLASWYPSTLFPYDGDFIQRHAAAAALYNEVELIHVVKDADGQVTHDVEEIVSTRGRLTERIIYYRPFKTPVSIINRFLSSLKYKKVYRKAVTQYMARNGKPGFIHVHIAMKAGLIALWLKKKYAVPYILSEQWGGYLEGAKPNINEYNAVYRYYWKKIFSQAMAGTFVSAVLESRVKHLFSIEHTRVIPNVVNTDIFYQASKVPAGITRFVHISTMTYQKNPEAMLEALHRLKETMDFEMYLYGPVTPIVKELITTFDLASCVFIMGEVPQPELAKAIRQSDALILYSRFETFGCVLIEANACGVPVIVSDLQVFHEFLEEGVNAVFVEEDNPVALAEKIKQFIAQQGNFENDKIAVSTAEKYNFHTIGKQFALLYEELGQ